MYFLNWLNWLCIIWELLQYIRRYFMLNNFNFLFLAFKFLIFLELILHTEWCININVHILFMEYECFQLHLLASSSHSSVKPKGILVQSGLGNLFLVIYIYKVMCGVCFADESCSLHQLRMLFSALKSKGTNEQYQSGSW